MVGADSGNASVWESVEEELANLWSDLQYIQEKHRILLQIRDTLQSRMSISTESQTYFKMKQEISAINKSISENDAECAKINCLIAKLECMGHPANVDTMKSNVMSANYEMVSWIMEGYAYHPEYTEISVLDKCLLELMSQPCPCKIFLDLGKVASDVCQELSENMRRALFEDWSGNPYGFSEKVQYLALYFIYAAKFENFTSISTEAPIYARYDALMIIAREFIDDMAYTLDAKVKTVPSNTFDSGGEKRLKQSSSKSNIPILSAKSKKDPDEEELFCPYLERTLRPDFQFSALDKFPFACFLMEGKKRDYLKEAKDDLETKLECLNERTFCGLPFYISAAVTPTQAQFMLSEYDRPIKEFGEVYDISTYEGAAKFLLAFLNLLPIFAEFRNILSRQQPRWNVETPSGESVTKAVSKKNFLDGTKTRYLHHIYLQKDINARSSSSCAELLHIYKKLIAKDAPDSLASPASGQQLAKIFTMDAEKYTIHLFPVAFPEPAEIFLTSYRLIAQCCYDILSALKWLHANKIAHRNVVGCNISKKICKKGFVLMNFESAIVSEESSSIFDVGRYDIEQLSIILVPKIVECPSKGRLAVFQELFCNQYNSVYSMINRFAKAGGVANDCDAILEQIKVCFEKYMSPFQSQI